MRYSRDHEPPSGVAATGQSEKGDAALNALRTPSRVMQRNMVAAARRAAMKARIRRTQRQLRQATRDGLRDWFAQRLAEQATPEYQQRLRDVDRRRQWYLL